MAYFSFFPLLSRPYLSNMYQATGVIKRHLCPSYFKIITSRTYTNSSKIAVLKPDKSLCVRKPFIINCNKIIITFCVGHPIRIHGNFRYFHTSERRYFHPIFWAVFRPVLKFVAVLTGRAFRKWWKDLPPNKKEYFIQSIKENRMKILAFVLTCIALSGAYYVSHLEEAPIIKRKRFIAFNSKQLEKINQFELQQLRLHNQKTILPPNHPSSYRVKNVVDRIVKANWSLKEVQEKNWDVAVINESVENAFVLPTGHVFVYAGMLSLCSTDEELAVILSHEIAHCIQGHGAENASITHLLDLISVVVITAIWAIIPNDVFSLFTHWLYNKAVKVYFQLPYSRHIEMEADVIGLQLAARACFDVRECSAFWAKMAILHRNNQPEIDFLSTHPSHEHRAEYLDNLMDNALKFRSVCGCPKLTSIDPRLDIQIVAKVIEATRQKYLHQFPKPAHSLNL